MGRSKEWYDRRFDEEYTQAKMRINQQEKLGIFATQEYRDKLRDTLAISDYRKRFRYAKSLNDIRKIQENSFIIDTETGEQVMFDEAKLKGYFPSVPKEVQWISNDDKVNVAFNYADITIQTFEFNLQLYDATIANRSAAQGGTLIMNWWQQAKDTYTKEELAYAIASANSIGLELGYEIMYDETLATNFINQLTEFLSNSKENLSVLVQALQTEMNDNIRLAEDEDGNVIS